MTLLFLLGMAEFVRNALVLSLLPLYGQTIGYSVGMIGTAISLQYLLDNAFRIPAGWLNDRRGGKWIITGGIVVSGCGLYLMYAHWNFNWFLIGAGLYGFGFAPVWPVVVAGVSARMPAARMSEALSRVFTCWLIGGGLGPVMINFIIGRSFGLAFKILLSGLLITVLIAVCGNFPPAADNQRSTRSSGGELIRQLFSLKAIYPGMFAQNMALGMIIPILAVYLRRAFGLSAGQYSLFLIGAGAFTVILLIPAGKLADRWGVKKPLICGFWLAAVSMALLPLQGIAAHALTVGAFIGIAYAFILPAWNGFLGRMVSPEIRGAMWAFFVTLEGLGVAAGSYVGGIMWDNFGQAAPFYGGAVVLAAIASFYSIWNMDTLVSVNGEG